MLMQMSRLHCRTAVMSPKGFDAQLFLERVKMGGRNLVLTVVFSEPVWGREGSGAQRKVRLKVKVGAQ